MDEDVPKAPALAAEPAGEPEPAAAHALEGKLAGEAVAATQLTPALPPALKTAWQTALAVQWEAVHLLGDGADQDAELQLQYLVTYYLEVPAPDKSAPGSHRNCC